jgi:hypothetical protein
VLSAGTSLLAPLGWTTPNAGDNLIWATCAFLALLAIQKSPRIPYALIVFILGIAIALFSTGIEYLPSLNLWRPSTYIPSWSNFKVGALDAGLGQVPLTTLNSIIAVSYLSADLLPHIPTPGVTSIGLSVAFMNLIGGWFGAMPVCHGSGGLAAQYRFGARSGASIIILGIIKMLLGIAFGDSLVGLLREYPKALLGVMVLAAGLELAKVGESLNYGAHDLWEVSESTGNDGIFSTQDGQKQQRIISDEERMERWTVMFMTIAGLLAFRNDGVGFIAGMLCHFAYRFDSLSSSWVGAGGRIRNQQCQSDGRSADVAEEEQQRLLDNTNL